MFLGSKHCEHCGVRTELIVIEPSATGKCPRCDGRLRKKSVGDIALESCDLCGGLWLGIQAFDQICNDHVAHTAASGLGAVTPRIEAEEVRYVKCPQCNNIMNRINYSGGSGVIIDVCRSHGIWLDKDELQHIIEFIRSGGVDRQRKKESDSLKQQRSQLEREKSSSQTIGAGSDIAIGSGIDLGGNAIIDVLIDLVSMWFRNHR